MDFPTLQVAAAKILDIPIIASEHKGKVHFYYVSCSYAALNLNSLQPQNYNKLVPLLSPCQVAKLTLHCQ